MQATKSEEKQEYRLDPAVAASLRVPLRTDLSKEEREEVARLQAQIDAHAAEIVEVYKTH